MQGFIGQKSTLKYIESVKELNSAIQLFHYINIIFLGIIEPFAESEAFENATGIPLSLVSALFSDQNI